MSILSDEFYYQHINLDTVNTQVFTNLTSKVGDTNGRGLVVTLTENGLQKDTTGISLNLKWKHRSVISQGLDNFDVVDLSKGVYKITYPTEMNRSGLVDAFVQIVDGTKIVGTRNMIISVESTVGDDSAIESSNSFTALASALIEVQSWNDRIDTVEQQYIDKANNLDATYPTRLVSVEQQLEQIETDYQAAAANITVDSEVILARNSNVKSKAYPSLDGRLEELESDLSGVSVNTVESIECFTPTETGGPTRQDITVAFTEGQYANCTSASVYIATDIADSKYAVISVTAGETIHIHAYNNWVMRAYVFTDDNNNRLAYYPSTSQASALFDGDVVVPDLATKLYIMGKKTSDVYAYRYVDVPKKVAFTLNATELQSKLSAGPIKILKKGDDIYIRTPWDSTQDFVEKIRLKASSDTYDNQTLQFGTYKLIDKAVADTSMDITGISLKSNDDDITPAKYNTTYIGANHGATIVWQVVATGHDKTVEDIGSEWLDASGRKYYLARIVDANTLWLMPAINNATWSTYFYNGGNFTHSLNATHTTQITVSSYSLSQLKPATKNQTKKLLLNGKDEITSDGVYTCDYLDVINTYDICDVLSVQNYIKSLVGGTTTPVFNNANIEVSARMTITYRFEDNGSCVIFHGFKPYKQILLDYMGFIQSMQVSIPTNGTLYQYIPKVLPVTVGSNTYDFKATKNITALNETVNLGKAQWENPDSPPDRFMQFAKTSGGANYFGVNLGYCMDIGLGVPSRRKDLLSDTFQLISVKKFYPKGISKNSTLYPDSLIPANTNFDMVAFRCPINYSLDTDATNISWYPVGDDIYLMLDYHKNIDKTLKLPDKFIGKRVSVIEKSTDFTVNSDYVSADGISIKTTNNYGSAVIKLS